jgi:hypothetical protein
MLESLVQHPIFIVGTGRSGTTVLQTALSKHPQVIASAAESPLIYQIGTLIYRYFCNHKRHDYYHNSLKIPAENIYAVLRRLCYESAIGKTYDPEKKCWCAKTFPTSEDAKGLIELFPHVKFLYVLRNGYDVVYSNTRFPYFRGQEFRVYCEAWSTSVNKYAYLSDCSASMQVRHEDLINMPERVFHDIFKFIEIEYHRNSFDFVKNVLVHPLDQPTQTEVDVKRVFECRQPGYMTWTDEQRRIFKEICGEAMKKSGYNIPF